jgi:hypothetical protein
MVDRTVESRVGHSESRSVVSKAEPTADWMEEWSVGVDGTDDG